MLRHDCKIDLPLMFWIKIISASRFMFFESFFYERFFYSFVLKLKVCFPIFFCHNFLNSRIAVFREKLIKTTVLNEDANTFLASVVCNCKKYATYISINLLYDVLSYHLLALFIFVRVMLICSFSDTNLSSLQYSEVPNKRAG